MIVLFLPVLTLMLGAINPQLCNFIFFGEFGFFELGQALILLFISILLWKKKILSLIFFILGMEELSWGQHLFNFKSPVIFESFNLQGETNLHNLVSFELFNGVLFQSINILLILIPLIYFFKKGPKNHSWMPSLKVVFYFLFSAGLCIYSLKGFAGKAEMEGFIFLLFFITSFILLLKYEWEGTRELFFILTLAGITGVSFFLNNEILGTKVYEIREFFICFALFRLVWEKRKNYLQRAAYILA